jgi:hypothetical protein
VLPVGLRMCLTSGHLEKTLTATDSNFQKPLSDEAYLDPPLTWYGSSVRLCGTVGTLRAVRLVGLVWYGGTVAFWLLHLAYGPHHYKDGRTGVKGGFP